MEFVKAFRNLIRLLNVSKSFTEFNFTDLNVDEQTFDDYKSKYLDIHDRTRLPKEEGNESIIEEVDFELKLIQRDETNVSYILKLLAEIRKNTKTTEEDYQQQKASILDFLGQEVQLRSKWVSLKNLLTSRCLQLSQKMRSPPFFKISGIKNGRLPWVNSASRKISATRSRPPNDRRGINAP